MEAMTSVGPLDEFLITVTPGEYDAYPPIPVFRMDYTPLRVAADRLALGTYLLFRPWISGELTINQTCTPLLAEAIREHGGFVPIQLQPLELRAVPIPLGRKEARVSVLDVRSTDASLSLTAGGLLELGLLRSDQTSGSFRTGNCVALASNAFALADSPGRMLEVAAGVCCLVAGDLDIADIWLPDEQPSADLAKLLRNVGLTLRLRETQA